MFCFIMPLMEFIERKAWHTVINWMHLLRNIHKTQCLWGDLRINGMECTFRPHIYITLKIIGICFTKGPIRMAFIAMRIGI